MRDLRPWTTATLVGALWGALELSLGTALHLGRVPLRGVLMALLGLVCLVTLRRLEQRCGVCLLAGAVAVFLKVFTLGGFYPGPLLGISLEALVVELAFGLLGVRLVAAVVGGALVVGLTPVQMTLMTWLVAGRDTVESALAALGAASTWFGLPFVGGRAVLIALVGGSALVGGIGGAWSWRVATRVVRRMGRV